jgi:hypothetical protein
MKFFSFLISMCLAWFLLFIHGDCWCVWCWVWGNHIQVANNDKFFFQVFEEFWRWWAWQVTIVDWGMLMIKDFPSLSFHCCSSLGEYVCKNKKVIVVWSYNWVFFIMVLSYNLGIMSTLVFLGWVFFLFYFLLLHLVVWKIDRPSAETWRE